MKVSNGHTAHGIVIDWGRVEPERGVFDMASALETLDEALLKSAQSAALTGNNAEKAKAMSDAIQSIFQPLPQRAKTV